MNTFTAGTKVRITEEFAKGREADGSMKRMVGLEGTALEPTHEASVFVPVELPEDDYPWLFFPEELEAV